MQAENNEQIRYNKPMAEGDSVLVYILTNVCNFRCKYCYEAASSVNEVCFQSRFQLETLMKTYKIFSNKYGIPKSIVFFGGEPFLEQDLIYKFINILKSEGDTIPKFAAITNASLMDENWIDFIAENLFAVTFSLDGAKAIHDKFRIDTAGQGTFQRVVENIRKFQEKNTHTEVTVEATLTRAYAEGDVNKLCKDTWNLFRLLDIPAVDYIPVEGNEYSLFQLEKTEKAEEVVNYLVDLWFEDLIALQLKTDVIGFRSLLFSLIKRLPPSGCSAGRSYFAVTPDLSIYTCQVALFKGEDPKWRFGEDGTIVEINGGFHGALYSQRDNKFCRECECQNGCTCYCRAQWGNYIPEKIPDICTFHRMARKRILEKIGILYENGGMELLKAAVIEYYGRKY